MNPLQEKKFLQYEEIACMQASLGLESELPVKVHWGYTNFIFTEVLGNNM